MTYEEYRDAWLERERQADADLRAGILPGGERMPYRYVGPPLIHTPDATIERAYLNSVQTRAYAWCQALLYRALTIEDPPRDPALTKAVASSDPYAVLKWYDANKGPRS